MGRASFKGSEQGNDVTRNIKLVAVRKTLNKGSIWKEFDKGLNWDGDCM